MPRRPPPAAVPTIVVLGGGGFSMEAKPCPLDDYILALAQPRCRPRRRGGARPRVTFLPTASGDSDTYIAKFHAAFPRARATAKHVSLFRREQIRESVRNQLLASDIIYVGGGNTANMLAVWRVHGVDRILREAWRSGIVLCGISAGMLCWFQGGVTDSFGRPLGPINDGLGFLAGSACPHYDGETDRRRTFERLIRTEALPSGIAADDGAAIRYEGRRLVEVVASRRGPTAYRVGLRGREIVEVALPVRVLNRRT